MIRLAHFVTHPIQYFAPLYRELSRMEGLELTVLFGSKFGIDPSFDEGFGQHVRFDVPLLSGYRADFVPNCGSGMPSGEFWNFDCPGMEKVLARGRFDVLWIHGWGYKAHWQAIRAARRLGIPYLIRGETNPESRPTNLLRRIARKLVVGRMLRAAAGCLFIGRSNRSFLRQMGVAEQRLFPAVYSVDAMWFCSAAARAQDGEHARGDSGCGRDTFVAVAVAKAIRRKRLQDAIDAVRKAGPDVQLWILGDGPERANLATRSRAAGHGQVYWHGFVNQSRLPALLGTADVFVLPSEEEPWGLAVNEAMACGLPVICSDRVGCARDLVREGVTGYVYPVGDVNTLAERIGYLCRNRDISGQMGQAAQELVLREYDVRVTARQIVAATHAVVAGKKASRISAKVAPAASARIAETPAPIG
jgi:glycosyltransferase involved in cell wall biosynthesis